MERGDMAQLRFLSLLFVSLLTCTYAKLRSNSDNSAFPVAITSIQPEKDPTFIPWTNPEGADCADMATFASWETSFFTSVSWNLVFSNWQFGDIPIENTHSWQLRLTFDKRNNYDTNATVTIAVRGEDTVVNILTLSDYWNQTLFTNVDSQQMIIPLSDYSDILTPANIANVVVILNLRLAGPEPGINISPLSVKLWCLTLDFMYYDCPNACSNNGACFASPVFGCVCSNTNRTTNSSQPENTEPEGLLLPRAEQEVDPIDCSIQHAQQSTATNVEVAGGGGSSSATRNALLGALLGGGFCLILVISLVLYFRHRRHESKRKYIFQTEKVNKMELGNQRPLHRYAHMLPTSIDNPSVALTPESPSAMHDYPLIERVELRQQLGGGNFGSVYLGEWNGTLVAVKWLNNEDAFREFEREASILAKLSHPNVVQFLGIYTDPIHRYRCIVTEYLPRGSLLDVLSSHKSSLKVIDLINMCINATSGMCYLEGVGIIHRDLAARNLLVTTDYTVKVGDFGLSRITSSYQANDTSKIPVKWTAPEVLEGNPHTSRSDVWSLGIVLWEIFTFGKSPYVWISNKEAVQLIPRGEILPIPPNCPDGIYVLMLQCWNRIPEERPTFLQILDRLKTIKKEIMEQSSQHKSYNIFVTDEDSPVRERAESHNSYTKTPTGTILNSKVSFDAEELERRRVQLQQQSQVQELRDSVLIDKDDEYEIVDMNASDDKDTDQNQQNGERNSTTRTDGHSTSAPGNGPTTQKGTDEYHHRDYQERTSKEAPPSSSDYGEFHLGAAAVGDEAEQSENDYEETLHHPPSGPGHGEESEEDERIQDDSSSSYVYRLNKVKRQDLDSSSSSSTEDQS